MTAYCLKCQRNIEMKNPQSFVMKNGRSATHGTCPDCGTRVFRLKKALGK